MRVDLRESWAGEEVDRSQDMGSAGRDQPLLKQLLDEVIRATGCNAALICRQHDNELTIAAGAGASLLSGYAPVVLNAADVTPKQAEALARIGCRAVQGHHFAGPLSPAQVTDLLAQAARSAKEACIDLPSDSIPC